MIVIIGEKSGKSYKKEISDELIGKRIGEVIDGSLIGLEGYELLLTGGSDKQGFPIRRDVEGQKRVRPMVSKGPGFRPKRKGERRRKNMRGRVLAEDIAQVNMKVVKEGKNKLEKMFKPEKKEEETKE